jgi:hypothetical protein
MGILGYLLIVKDPGSAQIRPPSLQIFLTEEKIWKKLIKKHA